MPESTPSVQQPDLIAVDIDALYPGGLPCDGAGNAAALSSCSIIYKAEFGSEIHVEPIERNHAGGAGLTVFKLVAGGAFDSRSTHKEKFLRAWNGMKPNAHHVESSARDHARDLGIILVHHEKDSMTVNLILTIGISRERHLTVLKRWSRPDQPGPSGHTIIDPITPGAKSTPNPKTTQIQ
nr:hypothetical protein [Bradyrhizobium brasilense]